MTSEKNKELFLKQFEQILEKIQSERAKVDSHALQPQSVAHTHAHIHIHTHTASEEASLCVCLAGHCVQFEAKRESEKTQKDRCNDEYLALVDKQRQYYKTVKEFQEVST